MAIGGLLIALLLAGCGGSPQSAPAQPSVAALQTEIAGQQGRVAAQQTEIARQQQRINQLQTQVVAPRTPTYQANGPHNYLVLFQVGKYSYILYLEWVESNGIIRDGRLLTADDSARKASRSFQFTGVDNAGTFGFTGGGEGLTLTFSGKLNGDHTLTLSGLPWSVFAGFTGGTFSRTLHPSTLQDYNAAAANLATTPR